MRTFEDLVLPLGAHDVLKFQHAWLMAVARGRQGEYSRTARRTTFLLNTERAELDK